MTTHKHVNFQGFDVRLDRPKGTVQKGTDKNGKPWERVYKVDYGYIPDTAGGDGDELDVFLGPDKNSSTAYWMIQKKDDGSFDEYKVVLGAKTKSDAVKIYTDHIPKKFLKSTASISVSMMKAMLGRMPQVKMAMYVSFLDQLQGTWGSL